MNFGFIGILFLVGVAVVCSENRRAIKFRLIASAFALQVAIAILALYVPFGQKLLRGMSRGVQSFIDHANEGIAFIFGPVLSSDAMGFVIVVRVLPIIIFVSSLMAVLYYLGIMQWIVRILGGGIRWIVGATRIESLVAAANVFVGMTEAPLVVKPYLKSLTRSQLFTVMAVGLSSISGAILAGYASLGINLDYLIASAFMAAPGGLLMAKLLIPDEIDQSGRVASDVNSDALDLLGEEDDAVNIIQAASDGAMTGIKIAVNVGGMLLAFVALISLANGIVGSAGEVFNIEGLTIEFILGNLLSPVMFLLGIPWSEAALAGQFVGQKLILNEFIAYVQLVNVQETMSEHTRVVVTFALCGFANLNSLAMLMGSLAGLIPERKKEVAAMGMKAILAGTLSNLMSAALASILLFP
ncbi:MAG: NupC/NupG family nucleoside CNT transporter [Pseudomonadales bacterium]|nr:NupC/NupG family nucleoside CNT transporter [Pseudomonadales bacterium]